MARVAAVLEPTEPNIAKRERERGSGGRRDAKPAASTVRSELRAQVDGRRVVDRPLHGAAEDAAPYAPPADRDPPHFTSSSGRCSLGEEVKDPLPGIWEQD